jgi:hypothetical protein
LGQDGALVERTDHGLSFWRRLMRSLLRHTLLASLLLAYGGLPGCSSEPESTSPKMEPGNMSGPMGKTDSGKMAGPMDKMESGKMDGAMPKMEPGKMTGPMDKMEKKTP